MRRTRCLITWLALLSFVWPSNPGVLCAQSTQGEILGSVTDPAGALVPGAKVTVTNLERGFRRSATTNETGLYRVPHLEPGSYSVTIEHAGFKQFKRTPLLLESGRIIRVDGGLEIGEVSQEVTVTEQTPVIETETGQIGHVVSSRLLVDVSNPTLRHPVHALVLFPAAYFGGGDYSFNGSRSGAASHQVDGIESGNPQTGRVQGPLRPDFETLQELRVDMVNAKAEYQHTGTINAVMKSGGNQLHGQGSWYHQDSALNARNFFSPAKTDFHRDFFYFTTGGPVYLPRLYDGRNRTFFLVHLEKNSQPSGLPSVLNVPTESMRRGDFSAISAVIRDPTNNQPFPGKILPASRIVPAASKYTEMFYPRPAGPNKDSALPSANYNSNEGIIRGLKEYSWTLRFDQKLSDKNTVYGRYLRNKNQSLIPSAGLPKNLVEPLFRINNSHSWIVSDTHVFTPTIVNELKLGIIREFWPDKASLEGKKVIESLGLIGYPYTLKNVFGGPVVSVTGLSGISPLGERSSIINTWNLIDNVTFLHRAHSFKTGFSFLLGHLSTTAAVPQAQYGSFSFNGFASGYGYTDLLLGIPRTTGLAQPAEPYYGSGTEWAVYFQDDWKVSSRLTLNLGVRYERHSPWTEKNDQVHAFDLKTGSVVVPNARSQSAINPAFSSAIPVRTAQQAGFPERSLIRTDTNDFAPRFSFAWRSPLSELVIRGGYGLYYNGEARQSFLNMVAGPFINTATYDNTITNGVPGWTWPSVIPANATARALGIQDVSSPNLNRGSSYVQQWNLTLERQLRAFGLRLSYIGSSARQLTYLRNINQPAASTVPFNQNRRPYPLLRNITYFDIGGVQSYHSLQAELSRRLSNGFSLNAHYTLAKNLTDVQNTAAAGGPVEDAFNRGSEYGNEAYTPRQRFVASSIWDVPVGKGRRLLRSAHPVVEGVLGGWQLSTVFSAYSGYFLTPTFSGRDISGTNITGGRPDRIADGNLPSESRTVTRWFDLGAFAIPAANSGRFGSAGRGIIVGPGSWGATLSVFKYFKIPGPESLKFRVEVQASNPFNHPKLGGRVGNPTMNISSGSAGRITSTDADGASLSGSTASREILIGVRVEW